MSLPGTNILMIGWKAIIPNVGIKCSQHGNKLFPRWGKVRIIIISIVFSRV